MKAQVVTPRRALAATALALALTPAGNALAQYAPPAPPAPTAPVAPAPALAPTPAPAPAATVEAPPAAAAELPPVATETAPVVAEAAPAPVAKKDDKPTVAVRYDKGFVLSSSDDKFETRISLRTQFRFETRRDTADGKEMESQFYIARARLQLEGHVYGADNRYKLEAALGDRGSFTYVRDAFLEHKVGEMWLRLGQWKRPHNRQELVSDFNSVFNERAINAELVGGGRDIGFAVHNDYEKSPEGLEWVFGIFNGFAGGGDRPVSTPTCTTGTDGAITCRNSTPSNFPTDFRPALVGRIGWNHGKIKGYSEGDLEGGPLRLAVGASYKVDLANFKQGDHSSVAAAFSHSVQADLLLKVEGLDVLAAVYLQKLAGGSTDLGGLLQAGYFLTPKKVQLAGRFALHEISEDRARLETRAALNYFLAGHAFKVASDAGMVMDTGEDAAGESDKPELQLRVMAQMTY